MSAVAAMRAPMSNVSGISDWAGEGEELAVSLAARSTVSETASM